MTPKVQLEQICKTFPNGTIANNGVNLAAAAGEIHAVLGENGAGKSTLMNILAGLYRPDSGAMKIDGKKVQFHSPFQAKQSGIGMVHQHFSLVPALTVAENLALGSTKVSYMLKPKAWKRFLEGRAEEFGIRINFEAYVGDLALGEQQRVEIFRLLLEGAEILILDEPTSILSPNEAESLFKHLRNFAIQGRAIFLVTHKIQHVRALASRVTILRKGSVVANGELSKFSDHDLAAAMVGSESGFDLDRSDYRSSGRSSPASNKTDRQVEPSTFSLHEGEILGIAGISGNGQDELAEALAGMRNYIGDVRFVSENIPSHGSRAGYITEDRIGTALALTMSLEENLAMRSYRTPPYSKMGILAKTGFRKRAKAMIENFRIAPPAPQTPAGSFSGGNMQKAVLARELDGEPPFIIASNPTSGLDIAAVKLVRETLVERADAGAKVLLISEDLDELIAMSDWIAIMRTGKIRGIFSKDKIDKRAVGFLMSADLVHYLKNPDRLDETLAGKLNAYPYTDVLRREVSEKELPIIMELAVTKERGSAVRGLAISLLEEFRERNEVREFLFRLWGDPTDFTARQSVIWRLLRYDDLPSELHEECYNFVKENWDSFLIKQEGYFGGSDKVISGVRDRLNKLPKDSDRAWSYLCASFASGNWRSVATLLDEYKGSTNEIVANCAKELRLRPELATLGDNYDR